MEINGSSNGGTSTQDEVIVEIAGEMDPASYLYGAGFDSQEFVRDFNAHVKVRKESNDEFSKPDYSLGFMDGFMYCLSELREQGRVAV